MRILVVKDKEENAISSFSAKKMHDALHEEFAEITTAILDQSLLKALPDLAPDIVIFSYPFDNELEKILQAQELLSSKDIPYLGSPLQMRRMLIGDAFQVVQGGKFLEPNLIDEGNRLFSVAVLEHPDPVALPVVEIIMENSLEITTLCHDDTEYICPANLPCEKTIEAQNIAIDLHQLTASRDFSRTEFLLNPQGLFARATFTNPFLSDKSLVALAAQASGYSFPDLMWLLVSNSRARKVGYIDSAYRTRIYQTSKVLTGINQQ